MRVLKGYTDAASYTPTGTPQFKNEYPQKNLSKSIKNSSGDSVQFSVEALNMLKNGKDSLTACAQDATYDQYGNLTRQVDALQRDINRLSMMAWPAGPVFNSRLNSLRSQAGNLSAVV